MTRYKAFAVHLLLSFLLFLVLAAVIKFLWYPSVLFEVDGGWEGIKLIAGVDLVIGPLLTLIVYNPAKKELRRDLATIGGLQVVCIVAGMLAVHHVRPVSVVYFDGVYATLGADDYRSREIDPGAVPLLNAGWPAWLSLRQPEDAAQREAVVLAWQLMGGAAFEVELYQPYADAIGLLKQGGYSLDEAQEQGISLPQSAPESARVYSISARYGTFPVLVDSRSGEIITLLQQKLSPAEPAQ